MKVRLPREVRSDPCPFHDRCRCLGAPVIAPPGIYEAKRSGDVYYLPDLNLGIKPGEFILLNDDGTQRMIRVRPDPGPTRQHFGWMYVANVDELQDAAFSAPPRRWQVETVDLTPEEVDGLPEFGGW